MTTKNEVKDDKDYFIAEVELKANNIAGEKHLTRRFWAMENARLWAAERAQKPDATGITAVYLIRAGTRRRELVIPRGD